MAAGYNNDPNTPKLQRFGSVLRKYRERAKLSQESLGQRIGYTGSFVGQVERGDRPCKRGFAEAADRVLDVGDALADLWDSITDGSGYPGWFDWPDYERKADEIRSYEGFVVYGLLQTQDYARAVLGGVESKVESRMRRQSILAAPASPRLYVLLDQSVLLRQVESPDVMREQLERLAGVDPHTISVQVLPLRQHGGDSGNFAAATLDDTSEVAYMDTPLGGRTITDHENVSALNKTWHEMRSLALPVDMSRDLIIRTVERRWT